MYTHRRLLTLTLTATTLGSAGADRIDFGPGSYVNAVPGGVMIVQTDQAPNATLPFLLAWMGVGPAVTPPVTNAPATTSVLAQSGTSAPKLPAPRPAAPVSAEQTRLRANLGELQPPTTVAAPAIVAQASGSRPASTTVSAPTVSTSVTAPAAPSSVSSADPAPAHPAAAAPPAAPSYASTRPTGDDVGSSTPSWLRGRFTATKGTANTTILYSLNNLSANTDVTTRIGGITIRLNGEVLNGASLSRTTTSQNIGTLNGGSMETGAIRLPANAKGTLSLDWALDSSEGKQMLHRTWTLN